MSNSSVLDPSDPSAHQRSSPADVYPLSFQVRFHGSTSALRLTCSGRNSTRPLCWVGSWVWVEANPNPNGLAFLPLQVSLLCFLVLEMVLGLGSNLTVLVLYCMKQNLISSVSNAITMNLHVVDVLVSPANGGGGFLG